jgi:hypothetical protein
LAKKIGISEDEVVIVLLPCLRFMVGGGRPYRMVYAIELKTAFTNIRGVVMKDKLFRRIRGVLTMRSDPLITVVQDHYDSSSIKRPSSGCVADILISICTYIVIADENYRKERLEEFSRELMSTPLLTLLLSQQGLKRFTKWELLLDVFRYFLSPNLALPPSSHEVFQSGQWVSGNVASLAPFMELNPKYSTEIPDLNENFENKNENIEVSHEKNIDGDFKSTNISDEYIEIYILLIISLLRRFNIPGVLQGKKGLYLKLLNYIKIYVYA